MEQSMTQNKKLWIPQYSVIPLIVCFLFNSILYKLAIDITRGWERYDFTTALDRLIPVVPSSTIVYLGCYIFWIVNYILIAQIGKEHFYRFQVADLLSRVVCFLFYIIVPTTNIRPYVENTGIFENVLNWVWSIDPAANLFPSIHCLVSWFCYVGIRGQNKVPLWYQRFSLIFAILVCISTQLTKQHYLIDVFGGILLAELTYYVGKKTRLYEWNQKIFEKINQCLGIERMEGGIIETK